MKKMLRISSLSNIFNIVDNLSIFDGVEAIHDKNFVHRDIKPDNIVSHTPDDNPNDIYYKLSKF